MTHPHHHLKADRKLPAHVRTTRDEVAGRHAGKKATFWTRITGSADALRSHLMIHLHVPHLRKFGFTMNLVVGPNWKESLKKANALGELAFNHRDIASSDRETARTNAHKAAHKKVFKKRTKGDLVGSGALVRSRKKPIAGFPKNKVNVVVCEGRTPCTTFALQDVLAHIMGFLGPKLINENGNPNNGQPVKGQHDNIAACARSEVFFRWSSGSYREFEDVGEVASHEDFMSDRETALVESLEK
jgi:hypothetical protein